MKFAIEPSAKRIVDATLFSPIGSDFPVGSENAGESPRGHREADQVVGAELEICRTPDTHRVGKSHARQIAVILARFPQETDVKLARRDDKRSSRPFN